MRNENLARRGSDIEDGAVDVEQDGCPFQIGRKGWGRRHDDGLAIIPAFQLIVPSGEIIQHGSAAGLPPARNSRRDWEVGTPPRFPPTMVREKSSIRLCRAPLRVIQTACQWVKRVPSHARRAR